MAPRNAENTFRWISNQQPFSIASDIEISIIAPQQTALLYCRLMHFSGNLALLLGGIMDVLAAASARDIFIPTNLPMMLNISHYIGEQYIKSHYASDKAKSIAIEKSLNLLVEKMHANAWDDYLVVLSRYLSNETPFRVIGGALTLASYALSYEGSLLSQSAPESLGYKLIERILLDEFSNASPRRLLSISEAVDVVASQVAHSTASPPT